MSLLTLITNSNFAASCSNSSAISTFLKFPTWYEYLPSTTINGVCTPQVTSLNGIWLIVAAVIEILLRVAAIIAVIIIIIGGIQFIISQGDPNQTKKARDTIINAVIGLVISISASIVVTFVAGTIR